MGIKEVVSGGYAVAKKSLKLMMGLLVCDLVFCVINFLAAPQIFSNANAETVSFPPVLMASSIVFAFLIAFLEGGSIAYVYETMKNGNSSLTEFIKSAKKYYMKLVRLGLLAGLILAPVMIFTLFLYFFFNNINTYLAIAVASIPAVFGIYYASVYWYLASYAIVIDDQNVRTSIKTGKEIAKKNILTFLGISLLMIAAHYGTFYVVDYTLQGTALLFNMGINTQIISSFLSVPVRVYFSVVMIGAFVNFYLAASLQNRGVVATGC